LALTIPAALAADKVERIVVTNVVEPHKKVVVVIMDADGSNRRTLSGDDALEFDPALSPDGQRIAFVVMEKDNTRSDIWVMGVDGKDRKRLTEHKAKYFAECVSWSPDGRRILFDTAGKPGAGPFGESEVMVMDADGKNAKSLGKGVWPSWSPDGKKILYTWINEGGDEAGRLHVMDADGKNAMQLKTMPVIRGDWAPDGRKILFTGAPAADGKSRPNAYVSNIDGSGPIQLTKDTGDRCVLGARWSRDGRRIYFNRVSLKGEEQQPIWTLWVMDADGKNAKELGTGTDLLIGAGSFARQPSVGRPAR
jgi:Tol biopolymer transport system component